MKRRFAPFAALALAACVQPDLAPSVERSEQVLTTPAPLPEDITIAAVEAQVDSALAPLSESAPVRLTPAQPAPPLPSARRQCWAREQIPALTENVIGDVLVLQAEIAPDGTVLRPPVYRRGPVSRIVRPKSELRFEAACPEEQTPEFTASLQRALAARGYFGGNITGRYDAPTSAAVRRYQADRGLDSDKLSLETARSLGLISVQASAG
jgi:hypothetical protein